MGSVSDRGIWRHRRCSFKDIQTCNSVISCQFDTSRCGLWHTHFVSEGMCKLGRAIRKLGCVHKTYASVSFVEDCLKIPNSSCYISLIFFFFFVKALWYGVKIWVGGHLINMVLLHVSIVLKMRQKTCFLDTLIP